MISVADREHMTGALAARWPDVRGSRIFVTGGTGFVGTWLLEAFAHANRELGLGARLVALTRHPGRFRERAPHLAADPAITLLTGDAVSFTFPSGTFAYVIHAATEAPMAPAPERPFGSIERDVAATGRILQFARQARTRRLLFTSSGAAYGAQPPGHERIPEDDRGAPLTTDAGTAYGHGKRLSEFALASTAPLFGCDAILTRLFAFVGPYLPLEANFAIGNFIGDALAGRPVRILGDGTARRSYLYAADLAVWLWTMLLAGEPGRLYNVGSPAGHSIREVAEAVVAATGASAGITIATEPTPGVPPARYVPDTSRAERELNLRVAVHLGDGIRRTFDWYRSGNA